MKHERTIRRHIAVLREMSEGVEHPTPQTERAYLAWHILRWVIEPDVTWTPLDLIDGQEDERLI